MTGLRDAIAQIITDWAADGCEEVPQDVADRILAISETPPSWVLGGGSYCIQPDGRVTFSPLMEGIVIEDGEVINPGWPVGFRDPRGGRNPKIGGTR